MRIPGIESPNQKFLSVFIFFLNFSLQILKRAIGNKLGLGSIMHYVNQNVKVFQKPFLWVEKLIFNMQYKPVKIKIGLP